MKPNRETLTDLYETQRLTTRQIGAQFGVSKTQISRWMKSYDIPRRPGNNGLANRGQEAPTAAELEWMVHVEHLSYEQIGERYGVDFTAVPYWLKKHGIAAPKIWVTRRKGAVTPSLDLPEVIARYEAGESLGRIAENYGVSRTPITARLNAAGYQLRRDGWNGGHRYDCIDGHKARSLYEQRVDDWLTEHQVDHEVEPNYPWDRRYMADFQVGETFIEVWGVTENEAYKKRKAMKIQRCAAEGIDLISINHWQFARGRKWWKPLECLVIANPPQPELPWLEENPAPDDQPLAP